MKILLLHDKSGCGHYRALLPYGQLQAHGHEVTFLDYTAAGAQPVEALSEAHKYDLVVGQRLASPKFLKSWLEVTTPKIYETDDDVFSITSDNWHAYEAFEIQSNRNAVRNFMASSDLITCSTPTLAAAMTAESGNRSTAVLPNFLPEAALRVPESNSERTIGWTGSNSHARDINVASTPVRRFLRQHDDWNLSLGGARYSDLFHVSESRINVRPWTSIIDSPAGFYDSISFSVGIAPLLDTPFNRSKSYLKALEYGARGIPVVASAVQPYKEYVDHGTTGFLTKDDADWSEYLELLADDEMSLGLRLEMGQAAFDKASENTIEKNWKLWADACEAATSG